MQKRRLRALRADQEPRLSQTRLAQKAQALLPAGRTMGLQRYWQIENGLGAAPRDDEKVAVAAVLGVAVGDIAWPALTEAEAQAS